MRFVWDAYIDGKLYVHHTPKFSVFTDKDSVGADRVDLISRIIPRRISTAVDSTITSIQLPAGDGRIHLHHHRRQGHPRTPRAMLITRRRPIRVAVFIASGRMETGLRFTQMGRAIISTWRSTMRRDVHVRQHRRRARLVDAIYPHGGWRILRVSVRLPSTGERQAGDDGA